MYLIELNHLRYFVIEKRFYIYLEVDVLRDIMLPVC